MGAIALFGADAALGPAVAQAARSHGSSVEQLEAAQGLRRLSAHDSLDAVIVGPSVESPVQLAQHTCLADPDLSVLLQRAPRTLDARPMTTVATARARRAWRVGEGDR